MHRMTWEATKELKRRLSLERGAITKDWGGKLPIAIVYPNSYFVGMSNLGMQTVYKHINADDRFVCERIFWEDAENMPSTGFSRAVGVRREQRPAVPGISIESQRPMQDFPVLAFSISYEQDYFNVVKLLKTAGIPLWSRERNENHPLIIAGGPCMITNPEPIAPFFDAIAVGEGEPILPQLMDTIENGINGSRQELLHALSKIPGIYVPSINKGVVERQYLINIDEHATRSEILTPETEFNDMYTMEVARGCGRGCRFCIAGYLFRPMRPRNLDFLLDQARHGLTMTNKIGLLGAAVADHPELDALVTELKGMGASISISSLRVDNLSDAVLTALDKSGARNVTVAPEAGSERMRKVVNKGLSEEQILDGFHKVGKHGIKQMKLYFIVGLPTETDEDAMAIADITSKGRAILDSYKSNTHIVVDMSPFSPKPGTAFQWHSVMPVEVVERRLQGIRKALSGKNIEVKWDSPQWSEIDTCLSRGGHELAEAIAEAGMGGVGAFRGAMKKVGLDIHSYVYKSYPMDKPLPWDIIGTGVKKDFFILEAINSGRQKEFPVCAPSGCKACGVC